MHSILYTLMNISIVATFAFAFFGFGEFEFGYYISVIFIGALLTVIFIVTGGRSLGKHQMKLYAREQQIQSSGETPSEANARRIKEIEDNILKEAEKDS
jgi:hypothetical protein